MSFNSGLAVEVTVITTSPGATPVKIYFPSSSSSVTIPSLLKAKEYVLSSAFSGKTVTPGSSTD